MSPTTAWLLVLSVAVALLAFAVSGLLGQVHRLASRITSSNVSLLAKPAPLVLAENGQILDPPYLALFVSRSCAVCHRLVQELLQQFADRQYSVPVVILGELPSDINVETGQPTIQRASRQYPSDWLGLPDLRPWLIVVDASGTIIRSEAAAPTSKTMSIFWEVLQRQKGDLESEAI